MAKKKEAKAKKATTTKPKQSGSTHAARPAGRAKKPEAEAAAATTTAAESTAAAPAPRERDARLPAAGTVLQKRDRNGTVRCECVVEEAGIRYKGTLYRSLSSAAMAAAKDLGLGGRSQNGYTFFGLSKPPRHGVDPLAALGRAWERYRDRTTAVVGAAKDDDRPRVHDVLGEHAEALKDLRGRVA